ncbi:hypothetical protein B5M42_011455 [Paenibacillus athensensis]|uniref:Uncharacterized protein n=1 Tax=Paenibacillus athensensis TaxID=1967502 RepID=A0A4Y8PQC4_9BACL|nr:hypothetical protein [Paenibacillus athensensis]MCD1259451.1 hypothetical protein [Paenibacillus athensensis]
MTRIRFQSFQVDLLGDASAINKGNNRIFDRTHSDKSNQGLGSVEGRGNIVARGYQVVVDNDQFDLVHPDRKK